MHGRIKVRTSEEEKERKKKEQALKVKAFRAAMGKIRIKRAKQELDDEMLQLTTVILLRNPDVATLWNVRRECVEQKAKSLQSDEEQLQAAYHLELGLTEQCLMVNPKSYNAWHHRCWTLENCPKADWEHEVQLCNKYLKLDERNFHTWSYRRYVVAKAGVAKQQELDFCTEKIKVNFSNYSSWHYRSLLLPELYPYEGDDMLEHPMSDAKLNEELDMVLTAAFTDPNDSSAWFYQRWLLGHAYSVQEICAFRCDKEKAVLALTKAMPLVGLKVILTDIANDKQLVLTNWQSLNNDKAHTTWYANLADNQELNFQGLYHLETNMPSLQATKIPLQLNAGNSLYYLKPPNHSYDFSDAVLTQLQSQLESCNSLLEYEPDSKWTLLTSALLMRAIDAMQYHNKSLEHLRKLQQVDALRANYYKDLASQWIMEKLLVDWFLSTDMPGKCDLRMETELTAIFYAQYFSIADELLLSTDLQERYDKGANKLKTFGNINK